MSTQSPRCRWCNAVRVRLYGGRVVGLTELKNRTSSSGDIAAKAMLVCSECDLPMGTTR